MEFGRGCLPTLTRAPRSALGLRAPTHLACGRNARRRRRRGRARSKSSKGPNPDDSETRALRGRRPCRGLDVAPRPCPSWGGEDGRTVVTALAGSRGARRRGTEPPKMLTDGDTAAPADEVPMRSYEYARLVEMWGQLSLPEKGARAGDDPRSISTQLTQVLSRWHLAGARQLRMIGGFTGIARSSCCCCGLCQRRGL
eukprot:scaffold2022_cov387-Prasinococcus_capsulatus_cf.AAC.4